MGQKIGLIDTNLSMPGTAYETTRNLVKKAVSMQQVSSGTKSAAIDQLTRKGQFGSWLLKLHKGHNVSIHLHLYVRLVEIVEQLAVKMHEDADAVEAMAAKAKGVRNARSQRADVSCAEGDHA